MKRIFLLPLLPLALGAATVDKIEQTLTQYPETERRKLALEQLQREAQTP
ncbi:hypothetical protein ABRX37_005957 [Pseudomonas aeruginosa]